ncbi:MAG: DUF4276 family protein, partial [Deltaproteobacteria bacterium]|nr:DUF4276 family protein [Deltaproteobacteria bacterium]
DEIGDQPLESVNDGKDTAPSKRLLRHIPGYNKALHGPLAVEHEGLQSLRASCPRFGAWLQTLERLGGGELTSGEEGSTTHRVSDPGL